MLKIYHIMIIMLCLLASCSPRIITQTETVRQIEHDTITIIKRVPVEIRVPVEVHTAISDTTSFLETSVAESQAYVDSLGRLHHYIANKAVPLRDTIPVHHLEVRTVESKKAVNYVEKKLSRWQKIKMKFGGWSMALLAALVLLLMMKWLASRCGRIE